MTVLEGGRTRVYDFTARRLRATDADGRCMETSLFAEIARRERDASAGQALAEHEAGAARPGPELPGEFRDAWRRYAAWEGNARLVPERSEAFGPAPSPDARPCAPDGEAERLIAGAISAEREGRRPAAAHLVADFDARMRAGHPMDALLVVFEQALETGVEESGRLGLALTATSALSDKRAVYFLDGLRTRDRRLAAGLLRHVTGRDLTRAYVVGVYEAEARRASDPERAETLYLAALNANPWMTAAWVDLGELYLSRGDPRRAWACWDFARHLAPGHPMTSVIEAREKSLAARHPDLF